MNTKAYTKNNFVPGINQNIISKIPKQIVLFFETNLKLANITILGCIETLFDSVLSLKKESKNSLMSLPLYLEVEVFIRDLAKLVKLVPTPYHQAKH